MLRVYFEPASISLRAPYLGETARIVVLLPSRVSGRCWRPIDAKGRAERHPCHMTGNFATICKDVSPESLFDSRLIKCGLDSAILRFHHIEQTDALMAAKQPKLLAVIPELLSS